MESPEHIPEWASCIARPPRINKIYGLEAHLCNVADNASMQDRGLLRDWMYLAGLLHDLGKARASWQRYIRGHGAGVNHAFLGSVLFFFLIQASRPPREYRRYLLLLCRDIADHHGALGDLEEQPPWIGGWQPQTFTEIDWIGVKAFLQRYAPAYAKFFPENYQTLQDELARMPRLWRKWVVTLPVVEDVNKAAYDALRIPTSRLIAADRFDAASIERDEGISMRDILPAQKRLSDYVSGRHDVTLQVGGTVMANYRDYAQREVLAQLQQSHSVVTTLQMPTGSGKTVVAMQYSLELMKTYGLKRIIYAAPYLSIVSQVAQSIREATPFEVLEQHHLALPDIDSASAYISADIGEGPLLTLESWQAPIVVTTFNQLFRALFPYSAQQSLRLVALEQAILIIDEPQIIDPTAWNAFLLMLETACQSLNARSLLMSATVPPHHYAMLSEPITQVTAPLLSAEASRYRLRVEESPLDSVAVLESVQHRLRQQQSVAVIVNTIGDVARLYQVWKDMKQDFLVLTLHGAMHALHKRYQIQRITQALEKHEPLVVIATQTLEAGIDLSFDHILRARPVFPSVVQAAGRANRHGQGSQAEVVVFDYLRPDGRDSRAMVYRDVVARDETDRILTPGRSLLEHEVDAALKAYYHNVFERNNYTVALEKITQAAAGRWSALAGLEPFGSSHVRESVFVPVSGSQKCPDAWVDDETQQLLEHFHVTVGSLYQKFLDPRTYAGSFTERKRFLNLFGRFVTGVPFHALQTLTDADPNRRVQLLVNPSDYSTDLGFAAWFLNEKLEEMVLL
ncbi:MAG: CRISPR-associated helicase/endonuclease Cas3 [Sulfobacillus thermosulfidooxidans]|nr:MAG: CRISPR-associated helicase/endonuclease Cas3 [Sulfobacillus thermosulfidooxidans]